MRSHGKNNDINKQNVLVIALHATPGIFLPSNTLALCASIRILLWNIDIKLHGRPRDNILLLGVVCRSIRPAQSDACRVVVSDDTLRGVWNVLDILVGFANKVKVLRKLLLCCRSRSSGVIRRNLNKIRLDRMLILFIYLFDLRSVLGVA